MSIKIKKKIPVEVVLSKPNTPEFNKFKEDAWILFALSDCLDQKLTELNENHDLDYCPTIVEATAKVKEAVAFFDKAIGWDNASKHSSKFDFIMRWIEKQAKKNVK